MLGVTGQYHHSYDTKKSRNAQHQCDLGIIHPENGFSTNIKYMDFNLIHISPRTIYYSMEFWGQIGVIGGLTQKRVN